MTIDDEIKAERARQEKLKAEGKFRYTCADPEMTDFERLSVLAEEVSEAADEMDHQASQILLMRVGQIATACNDGNMRPILLTVMMITVRALCGDTQTIAARTELVQVAAVCTAWLEAIDRAGGGE